MRAAFTKTRIYGKLICPRGHGQLALATVNQKIMRAKWWFWACTRCSFKRPCKWQGGIREHARTNRKK